MMRKSDKKREKQLILALRDACEEALLVCPGFQWLTHWVDYQRYPASLLILCVLDTEEHLCQAKHQGLDQTLIQLIEKKLDSIGIPLHNPSEQIQWDSEQACAEQNQGSWNKRLARH